MTVTASMHAELERQVDELFVPSPRTGGPGRVGIEVELFPFRVGAGGTLRPATPAEVEAALRADPDLRADGCVSFEPGGQLELSPPSAPTITGCLASVGALVERAMRCAAASGLRLLCAGVTPWHTCDEIGLLRDTPRYRAMQAHFDHLGPGGRRMMRQTAALQVCVDSDPGDVSDHGRAPVSAWYVLNVAGPALAAAFANAPVRDGRPAGMASARLDAWLGIDPTRTGFLGAQVGGADREAARRAYLRFAIDAHEIPGAVACGGDGAAPRQPSHGAGAATTPDALAVHLTTLFPPVRPRGYLEVRYLDALPRPEMELAVSVVCALVADSDARHDAAAVCAADRRTMLERWRVAAHAGVRDRTTREVAIGLLAVAAAALERMPRGSAPEGVAARVRDLAATRTARGLAPGDERLHRFLEAPLDAATWAP